MNYRRNHIRNKIFTVLLSAALFIGIAYFAGGAVGRFASNVTQSTAVYFWNGGNSVKKETLSILSFFASKKNLEEENIQLKDKIAKLEMGELIRIALFKENEELKKLLKRDRIYNTVIAAVVTRPNASPYDTFIIDVGEDDGVSEGDRVLAEGVFVIGEIARVYKHSSVVELFSSPDRQLDVLIGDGKISAVAKGRGGQNFEVELPRDTGIAEGDIARIPDIGMVLLGTVEYINRDPNASLEYMLLRSPVNMFGIKWVEVMKVQDEENR